MLIVTTDKIKATFAILVHRWYKTIFVYVTDMRKAVATRPEIYSRSDEAKLDDVSCQGHVDVGQLSDALLRSW